MLTNAEIIDRIEKNTRLIYEAATYTSVTQARLRSIQADLDVLKAQVGGRCSRCEV